MCCCCVGRIMNNLSFQTCWNFAKTKNKNEKESSLKDKTEQPPLPSNLPLLSLLSPLSQNVVEIRTTSRFSPQRVGSAPSFDLQIYIYTITYIFVAYHLSAEFTNLARIYLPWVRAHKQTQRWPRRSATAARRWRRRRWKKIIIARLIDLEEDLLFPMRTTGWEQQRRTKERTE